MKYIYDTNLESDFNMIFLIYFITDAQALKNFIVTRVFKSNEF